ncbi:uncharacterized protein Z518_04185 [Rhinocladiella mackenziei CBS 650.93]|uniref:Altered inheritance of mitochondria protein 11 n=1 Tax=Rhinocladiella mackenziei CBS 650.93 TaxID=1442369 RepID=A0A0D2JAS3_9EURO|nr:uncharacterized protein Z518_04185 [Rhinocladiella mackenziei CBS 650.93]KIX06210.1 hypothetical protein Z518_04185 [Rhinocladiella mackenziei CBS 650.93]
MSWFTSWFTPSNTSSTPAVQSTTENKRLAAEPSAKTEPVVEAPKPSATQAPQVDRPHRNKVIFGAGVAFFGLSLLITRRAFARKRLAANPAFYAHSPGHQAEQARQVSGPMEAFEALNIATINVLSLAMMATGGTLWYLDINSMADARMMLRGGLGVDGTGKSEKEAEEEFEEWMGTVLARKEAKGSGAPQTNERGQER